MCILVKKILAGLDACTKLYSSYGKIAAIHLDKKESSRLWKQINRCLEFLAAQRWEHCYF